VISEGQQMSLLQYLGVEVPAGGDPDCITVETRCHAGMRGVGAVRTSGMPDNLRPVPRVTGLFSGLPPAMKSLNILSSLNASTTGPNADALPSMSGMI
jgi:hypothetical protein